MGQWECKFQVKRIALILYKKLVTRKVRGKFHEIIEIGEYFHRVLRILKVYLGSFESFQRVFIESFEEFVNILGNFREHRIIQAS